MWDRTITLSSCGKTFSITGWQAGWMIGPSKYIIPVHEMIPCVQFCASTPIQAALSLALPQATLPYEGYPTYYEWLRSQFSTKRKILETGLKALNMESMPSRGGFFLLTKLPKINLPEKYNILNEPYDWKYCRMLAHDYGVVGIPASPFFSSTSSEDSPSSPSYTGVCMARFAICKKDETLQLAARKLMSSPNLPTSENILIR
jgi:aspartate/methionine/tyrosine aminotransferase